MPYASQWQDLDANRAIIRDGVPPGELPGWHEQGYPWRSAFDFWSYRACGIACLESVLDHAGIARPGRYELICDAVAAGAYRANDAGGVDGLIYHPFGAWVHGRFDLECEVMAPVPLEQLLGRLTPTSMVIASVSSEIRDLDCRPARRGGHLVLVTGRTEEGEVVFHNPSGVDDSAVDARLSGTRFDEFFAERGMVLTWE